MSFTEAEKQHWHVRTGIKTISIDRSPSACTVYHLQPVQAERFCELQIGRLPVLDVGPYAGTEVLRAMVFSCRTLYAVYASLPLQVLEVSKADKAECPTQTPNSFKHQENPSPKLLKETRSERQRPTVQLSQPMYQPEVLKLDPLGFCM